MTATSLTSQILSGLWQACRATVVCLIVVASLLVFPNAIPWLAAAWLLVYSLLVFRGRSSLVCLGICAAVLIAKRLTPSPGLIILLSVMLFVLAIGLIRIRRFDLRSSKRFLLLAALALWLSWGYMTYEWYSSTHGRRPVLLQGDRPIVCLGDSMTSLGAFGGYPQELRKMISLPVVDMGLSGISAEQVCQTYLSELKKHNPQVVVIELGAHDFLRDKSRASTKQHLLQIIQTSRELGAEVVLMEIPRSYISDPFWGLEREIARQENVELIPDTALRTIFLHSPLIPPGSWLGEPYLTDELGIHPNARGHRLLAEYVADTLAKMGCLTNPPR